jgi:hypothetical protein
MSRASQGMVESMRLPGHGAYVDSEAYARVDGVHAGLYRAAGPIMRLAKEAT